MAEVRRLPRYSRFLVTGGLVGVVAAIIVVIGPGADVDQRGRLLALLLGLLTGLGALLGGIIAVLLEARRR
jgi:MFS family permease